MVIHNDELAYYEVVAYMQRYIDYCIVISSKIKSELIEYGFNTKKIVVINWNIPVDEKERSVNENNPIRIGYAGRITKTQKRLDYLPLILEYLENKGADYIFEMAGIGDYFNELSDYIKENNLNEKVILLGIVDKKQMHDFGESRMYILAVPIGRDIVYHSVKELQQEQFRLSQMYQEQRMIYQTE